MKQTTVTINSTEYRITALTSHAMGTIAGAVAKGVRMTEEALYEYAVDHPTQFTIEIVK